MAWSMMKKALALMFDRNQSPADVTKQCLDYIASNPDAHRQHGVAHVVAIFRNVVVIVDGEDRHQVLEEALGSMPPQYASSR